MSFVSLITLAGVLIGGLLFLCGALYAIYEIKIDPPPLKVDPKATAEYEQPRNDGKKAPAESVSPPPIVKMPARPIAKADPPTVTIQTGPIYGNLKQRAIALSNEVLGALKEQGWHSDSNPASPLPPGVFRKMPTKEDELNRWINRQAEFFEFRYFKRVVEIRNEFAELRIRDDRLDDFLKRQGLVEQSNGHMVTLARANAGASAPPLVDTLTLTKPVLPQDIESAGVRLRAMANSIP